MHIPILTGVLNVHISRWRNSHILIKILFLKHIFQDESHLQGKFLFYILSIYRKCLLFQFLSRGKRMLVPILTGVQKECISKNAIVTHNLSIWFYEVASNCCCFRNITKNYFFFFSYVVFLYMSKMPVLKSR